MCVADAARSSAGCLKPEKASMEGEGKWNPLVPKKPL